MGTMGFFSASLGLNCTDCHVDESGGNWAKYADDNARKQTARRMMQMVAAHQSRPASAAGRSSRATPAIAAHRAPTSCQASRCCTARRRPTSLASRSRRRPASRRRSRARQVSAGARRRRASGRAHQLRRQGRPTSGFDDADKSPLEIFAQGSGSAHHHRPFACSGDSTTTYDGRAGWIAAPEAEKPVPLLAAHRPGAGRRQAGSGVVVSRRGSSRRSPTGASARRSSIGDREVQPVQGTTRRRRDGHAVLRLRESGLLVRLVRFTESPVGRIVTQIDYSDYRDVSGVKMPFRWTVTWLDGRSTFELTDVQPNVRRRGEIREAGAEKVE